MVIDCHRHSFPKSGKEEVTIEKELNSIQLREFVFCLVFGFFFFGGRRKNRRNHFFFNFLRGFFALILFLQM